MGLFELIGVVAASVAVWLCVVSFFAFLHDYEEACAMLSGIEAVVIGILLYSR